jgi:hypothetical protein
LNAADQMIGLSQRGSSSILLHLVSAKPNNSVPVEKKSGESIDVETMETENASLRVDDAC